MKKAVEEATASMLIDMPLDSGAVVNITVSEALEIYDDRAMLTILCETIRAGVDGRLYFHIHQFEW